MSSTRMFSVVLQASNFAAVLGKNERFRGNFGEDHDHHLLIFFSKKSFDYVHSLIALVKRISQSATQCTERLQNDRATLRVSFVLSTAANHKHIKYSLDFLRPIRTAEAFEAVDWLADLPPTNMAASSRPVE